MKLPRSLDSLSRQELFDLVWSIPVTKIGAEYGVTDVAVHKRCKRLQVPTPPRGYWAKKEHGKVPKRPELPPTQEEIFAEEAKKPIPSALALPQDSDPLHPFAGKFLTALKSEPLSYDKQRVHLRNGEPEAEISKSQASRAAGVFHRMLEFLEPRGIPFRKSQGSYTGGHFRKGHDRLYFRVEEDLVDKPEGPKPRRRYYSWQTQANKVPCGRLTFSVSSDSYGMEKKKRWQEGEKLDLEGIISEMVKAVWEHFVELQRQRQEEEARRENERIEWETRRKKEMEEEAIRQQEETKRKHAESLERAARTRQEDLLKASEWWRLYRGVEEFVAECERRWRAAQQGELTGEQSEWLRWAREVSQGVSPFESGYPDPAHDGRFDAAAVPFGGPYPEQRTFPEPPTMPKVPPPVIVPQSYGQTYHPEPKPYPFWLKYQRR